MQTFILQEPWYVKESKEKCLLLEMDPSKLPSFNNVLPENELNQKRLEYKEILSVVNFFVQKTLDHLQGYPILIVITDENGAILEMAGDETIRNTINQLGIKTGLQFEEDVTGTNSITLALKYRHAVQLIGEHHFHQFLHQSACYTVPFRYTNAKQLLGTISIMTSKELHHLTLPTMLNTVVDTIERELVLRLQNRKLHIMNQIMVDSTRNGIIMTDKEGLVIEFNQFAQEFLGLKKNEVFHQPVKHIEKIGPYIDEITKSGAKKENLQIIFNETSSRDKRVCIFDALPIYDEHSLLVGAYGQFRDMTESYKAKEEAEKASQAKSEFLSSMSHELRTPLNAVIGFAQLLEYDDTLSESQQDDVQEILSAGNHLHDLINEVLDLARIESNKVQLSLGPVNLNSVMNECVTLLESIATTKNVQLVWSEPSKDFFVHADRVRIKQALLNLISNAIKYNIENGRVILKVEQKNERIKVNVIDTGTGIPSDKIAFIFQPFNRLSEHQSIEGTGIGLSITKQLIELMGGTIAVLSEKGKGSNFSIELPLHENKKDPLHQEILIDERNIELAELNGIPKTILYIEDNVSNQKIISRIFKDIQNIKLITSTTAEEGIVLAQKHLPDVILLDINLPGMNGFEAFEQMQDIDCLKNIPVIGLSANAMATDIKKAVDLGFKRYITKPIQISTFIESINEVLKFHSSKEEFRSDLYKFSLGGK